MPDPLILIDPVQQNDFTARAIAFPNDPLPGNLVDGEFAHIRAILGTAVNILQGITSPDGLSIGQVIGLDQLTPGALDALAQTVTDAVASDTATAQGAAVEATAQKNEATAQADAAIAAATAAVAALTVITDAQAATVAAISALTPSAQASADDAADSASAADSARDAAEVASTATIGLTDLAGAWAEHMPGTIPPDKLAVMAITGDHWSARWWANQAAQVVSAVTDLANNAIDLTAEFNKIYLGTKVSDPSLDNENEPLLVGALYFNSVDSELLVWSGTIWTSASGTGGFVVDADNLGGGLEVFKDKVTGVLNFRSITATGGLGAIQTANEIQLTIDSVAWAKITGRPTTLAGYGIADAYTKAQIDAELDAADAAIAARATIAYVNSELDLVDAAIAAKADGTATASALSTLTTDVSNRVVRTSATGGALLPAGTTAQRDGSPVAGSFRFNSTLGVFEGWNGAIWVGLGADLSAYMLKASNLSDLANIATALASLGISDRLHTPGQRGEFWTPSAPAGWLKANGAVVTRATYAALDTAIYCGDALNATASWGYRTNSADTARSIAGTHIKLPDARGEFSRGWDDGRGVDSGRTLWSAQAEELKSHAHTTTVSFSGDHTHTTPAGNIFGYIVSGTPTSGYGVDNSGAASGPAGNHNHVVTVNAAGGVETRPRNLAALVCIKF